MSRTPPPLAVTRRGDGSADYITVDGDMLDHLCWRHYGYEWDTVEATLNNNPGLAAKGIVYPAGVVINFPYIQKQTTTPRARKRLFD